MLSREEMLQRGKLRTTTIEKCGDWGQVTLRQMSLERISKVGVIQYPPSDEQLADLIVNSVVNDAGEYVFTDGDKPSLKGLGPHVTFPLWLAFRRLNEITDEDIEAEVKN